jgi:hypothetical protein
MRGRMAIPKKNLTKPKIPAKKTTIAKEMAVAEVEKPQTLPRLLTSLTPQITLTATLQDVSGNAAGNAASPAVLRIALCGFGLVLPCIVGTSNIAQPGPEDFYDTGGGIDIKLWGNDVINPLGTYYAITILDGDGNILQCGSYQFTGTQTIDLSSAPQIVPTNSILYAGCSGAVPGRTYTAPGVVVMALYNGNTLRPGIDYSLSNGGTQINLTFTTQAGEDWQDNISALCTVVIPSSLAPGASLLQYALCTGDIPGTVYTAPGKVVAVAYNGNIQPTDEYSLDASRTVITLDFSTAAEDTVYALCF